MERGKERDHVIVELIHILQEELPTAFLITAPATWVIQPWVLNTLPDNYVKDMLKYIRLGRVAI